MRSWSEHIGIWRCITYFVYILECADQTLYTGWTTDINRRLAAHNAGRGARYTRQRGPVRLVYQEEVADHRAALEREQQIKRLPRAAKLKLVEGFKVES